MELAFIFVLELGGLLLGALLARAAFGATPSAGVTRVFAALERARRAFLVRAFARFAAVAGAAAAAVLAFGFASGHAAAGIAGSVGMLLGAAFGVAAALGASFLGSRAAAAAVARAGARFDLALTTAVRSAGASGVVAQTLGVIGALTLLGAGYWLHHADIDANAAEVARRTALALPGYAFGAALVALWLRETCGAYAVAARAGELCGELVDPSVARVAPRNPALVSSLVGERLEHGASAARLFAASATAAVAVVFLAVGSGTREPPELRFVAFPLLLWGFGVVANGAGLLVARSLEAQGALPALLRGQVSAAGVWLVGLSAAGYWLYPDAWLTFWGVGLVGLLAGAAVSAAAARAFARRSGALREALDGLPVGAATPQAAALGFGLQHAALALALVAAVGFVVHPLGTASGSPGGSELALLLALFAATAFSPYALAVEAGTRIVETARASAPMASSDGETIGRLQRVADSMQLPAATARSALTLVQALSALAGALALAPGMTTSADANTTGWATPLGVGLVLFVAGGAARRSARAARELAVEVERQLKTTGPEPAPEDRAPSYRTCEELAARLGLGGAASGAASVLLGPVLLGIALRLVYRDAGPRLAAEALATFVAGAAVTALGVALAVDGARAVLAGARRANRPEGDPATHAASVTGSALAEILGSAVGPAACTTAAIATTIALLARTFLL
jgi:K(+)-stimulated pyrophosphate-energized sodium pump